MLNPDQQALVAFVQREARRLPIEERAAVYRGIAEFLEEREMVHAFVAKARALEAAEVQCAELDLNFQRGGKV